MPLAQNPNLKLETMEPLFSFTRLIQTGKELLVDPKVFWEKLKEEPHEKMQLLVGVYIPLVVFAAIAVFLGEFFKSTHFYVATALLKSLRIILLYWLQYYLAVMFTRELMKTFGGTKDTVLARNLVVYSMIPLLLVSMVTGLFQFLYVLDVLGFYSFFIFWIGADVLLNFPENKKTSYTLLTIVVNFFVFSFLSITLSKLLTAYY